MRGQEVGNQIFEAFAFCPLPSFDFSLVLITTIVAILELTKALDGDTLGFFRTLRSLRFFKLLKSIDELRRLMKNCMLCQPQNCRHTAASTTTNTTHMRGVRVQ